MKRVVVTGLLGAAALWAQPGAAKSLTSVPARLDPAKAYVLVEVGDVDGGKLAGQLTFARYDQGNGDVKGLGRAAGSALPKKVSPHETTTKAVIKEKRRLLYLMELEPDFWVIEGANGTAFSLGSVGGTLAPGTVTDLGVVAVRTDYAEGDGPEKLTAGKLAKAAMLGPLFGGSLKPKPVPTMIAIHPRTAADLPVPVGLQGQVTAATWSQPVKFGNHLGGLVNRMGGRQARGGRPAAE